MSAEALGTILLAVIAAVGLIGGSIAWFYKRGGQEREGAIALRDNTKATVDLTTRIDAFMLRTEAKQEATDLRVNNHETRLSLTEQTVKALTRQANGNG